MELFFNSFLVMFISAVVVMFALSLYLYLYLVQHSYRILPVIILYSVNIQSKYMYYLIVTVIIA